MPYEEIDWKRVAAALLQTTRRHGLEDKVPRAIATLQELLARCGEFSRTSKMARRIGQRLLDEEVRILAPACPDYGHQHGRYTFQGLSGEVSLLAEHHLGFLRGLTDLLPGLRPTILYADHEADDPELCRRVGKTRPEFLACVRDSVEKTRAMVGPWGWQVLAMTELIPDLVEQERAHAQWIAEEAKYRDRIHSETGARIEMYQRINSRFTFDQMRTRTIATAAQYVAMGKYAAGYGYLLCNHTTVNLSWYLQTEAAVLHNPVAVY